MVEEGGACAARRGEGGAAAMIGAGGAGRGAVAMGTRGPRSPRRPREGPAAFAALPVPLAQLAKQERFPFPEDAFPFLRTARMRGSGAASPPPLTERDVPEAGAAPATPWQGGNGNGRASSEPGRYLRHLPAKAGEAAPTGAEPLLSTSRQGRAGRGKRSLERKWDRAVKREPGNEKGTESEKGTRGRKGDRREKGN